MIESERSMTFGEALRSALADAMRADDSVMVFGEDVELGYGFGVTKGLVEEFGATRVRDTPMSELGIIGAAVGAAMCEMRPVPEIQFCDFLTLAMDQIVNQAAKMRYMSGGQVSVPLTIRAACGHAANYGAQHSQVLHAWFCHTPGLVVVMPSTPADARGLLLSAIYSDDPVLFLEHKKLYGVRGAVPTEDHRTPLGRADVKRTGQDVTVVATGWLVNETMTAASRLSADGIEAEVIDPRTLYPIDTDLILSSVRKTGRLVVADQAPATCGYAAEICALVAENALEYLEAPVQRVTTLEAPIPASDVLEAHVIPNAAKVEAAVRRVVA